MHRVSAKVSRSKYRKLRNAKQKSAGTDTFFCTIALLLFLFHPKNFHLCRQSAEKKFGAFGSGVGYEQLSENVIGDHLRKLGNATVIQFIENIVEQQDGAKLLVVGNNFELCQFERNYKRFLLALRTKLFERKAVNLKGEIVFVRPFGGSLQLQIAGAAVPEVLHKARLGQLRFIYQIDHFPAFAQVRIMLLEYGLENIDKAAAALEQQVSQIQQGCVVTVKHVIV